MAAWCEPREPVEPSFLLVGPYDPHCGEYTFLAPPLGVWRLQGVLEASGFGAQVFDPNACGEAPEKAFEAALRLRPWSVVGFSTTGMTLRFDLGLAHLARRLRPEALLVAGGMEVTFNPEQTLRLGPFDLGVLGEGERPLVELGRRLRAGASLDGIAGTVERREDGRVLRRPQLALTRAELADAIFKTPYEMMPFRAYWRRLEDRYRVGALPFKADREARLSEIRSVRLVTLNYCPMNCSFCSSTNFLNAAQASTARVARLDAGECLRMIERIVDAYPDVRTVIFQDDIFVFTADARILPLCDAICEAKSRGRLPRELQFISTNRIDAMTDERLERMQRAGFRVLGFGVEHFSRKVLAEFNKAQIHPHIAPVLGRARALGITPFLDMILTSPRSSLGDLAETLREAFGWILRGCEVGMYPYVIPFSGAAMARDPELVPHTVMARRHVPGTAVSWDQPAKILPIDARVREAILRIEQAFEAKLGYLERRVAHLPSRVRSLLWVLCAVPVLARLDQDVPPEELVLEALLERLPVPPAEAIGLERALADAVESEAGVSM